MIMSMHRHTHVSVLTQECGKVYWVVFHCLPRVLAKHVRKV